MQHQAQKIPKNWRNKEWFQVKCIYQEKGFKRAFKWLHIEIEKSREYGKETMKEEKMGFCFLQGKEMFHDSEIVIHYLMCMSVSVKEREMRRRDV